jgi:tRNA nucleotidyltransferase (CCA-adding enzyme)
MMKCIRGLRRLLYNVKRINSLWPYADFGGREYSSCKERALPQLVMKKIDSSNFQSLFSQELQDLASIFKRHGYELRFAGGPVRDLLTGKIPNDLDFATTATPEQMKKMFEAENVRMINRRGEEHGTVTCRINDKTNFEVTTLRIDVVTDGRHAQVEFTKNWQLDAERRDLTVNSMFLGLDGTLYDYFGGQQDLIDRRVCFVGNAAARIQEDFLRILRYFRFYGRIAELPNAHDDSTLKAIRDNAQGLAGISGERIWMELKKIVVGNHAGSIVRVMFELGVTRYLGLPNDANLDEFERVWKLCLDMSPQPMTILSALLKTEEQVLAFHDRVKMSNDEKELGLFIVRHRDDSFGDEPFDHCADLICDVPAGTMKTKQHVCELLKYLDLRPTLDQVNSWVPPRFPVRGEDVLEAGVPKGPSVGKALNFLRHKWKESRYTYGVQELLEFIDEAKKNL